MNIFKRKLRSQSGASLIIALVFLLFCAFVGGSVLASATANAYRVEHLSDQQDFLSERSAAMLLADELRLTGDEQLRLNVTNAKVHTQIVTVGNGGVWTPTSEQWTDRVVTFQVVTNMTTLSAMQRLMLESTVLSYLKEEISEEGSVTAYKVQLVNFPGLGTAAGTYTPSTKTLSGLSFWIPTDSAEGTMTITGPTDDMNFTARVSGGTGENKYNFYVDFQNTDPEAQENENLMSLTMDAYSGTRPEITASAAPTLNAATSKVEEITSTYTETIISWDDPYIAKGGANG